MNLKGSQDFGSSHVSQGILLDVLSSGFYKNHLKKVNEFYQDKSEFTNECLVKYMPEFMSWEKPEGGLYYWLQVELEQFNSGRESPFFEECLRREVLYIPGEICYSKQVADSKKTLRITYAMLSKVKIEEGVKRLGLALHEIKKQLEHS